MNKDCQSWMALSDKSALGEPLSADELGFSNEHLAVCRACSTEANVWSALEDALEDPRLLTESLGPLTGIAAESGSSSAARWPQVLSWSKMRVRSRAFMAVAAIAAMAVGTLTVWHWRAAPPALAAQAPANRAPTVVASPGGGSAEVAFVTGEARINQRPAAAGERLQQGDTLEVGVGYVCLLVPPGVTVCVEPHSALVADKLETATRRFKINAGQALARLEHQPLGSTFGFDTSAGSVVAKGTIFSVEVLGDEVGVRVHEGTVIGTSGLDSHAFVAPVAALLSAPLAGQLPDSTADDARLLELAKNFTDRATALLEITSADGGEVRLDEADLGSSPLSALVAPGSYRLSYEHAGVSPIAERLTLAAGEHVSRNYEAPNPPSSGSMSGASAQYPAASPAALLTQARELRAEGHFSEAGFVYRRLIHEHGSSSEARVALVSLGELQLSQLGDPNGALKSFDAYLRTGGALAPEASYGKIRAFRALGRQTDEQAATDAFLHAYPQSVQAASLRRSNP